MAVKTRSDRIGVQTCSASSPDDSRLRRVDPLIDGNIGDCLDHVFGPDAHHCRGRFLKRHFQRFRHISPQGLNRSVLLEDDATAKEILRIDIAENEGCVGHRCALTARAITGWSGSGAGTLGTDMEHAATIDPGQAAATCADAFDIDRGKSRQIALIGTTKPGFMTKWHAAVAH